MKIQRRITYTGLLLLGCVLLAWPNSMGKNTDGKYDSTRYMIQIQEEEQNDDASEDIRPFFNLLPSCNLNIH